MLQDRQGHSQDHLVPLLEGQQAILKRFENLDDKNEMLANELERMNARESRNQDEVETSSRQQDLDRIAGLTEQLQQLKLNRQRDQYEAEQTARDLSSAKERIDGMQSDIRMAKARADQAVIDQVQSERQRHQLMADRERLEGEVREARNEVEEEKRRRDAAAATLASQAWEMAQLRQLTTKKQETMLAKLAIIEQAATVDQSSPEQDSLREKNITLEQEIAEMRRRVSTVLRLGFMAC